jgi:hypothetical protein
MLRLLPLLLAGGHAQALRCHVGQACGTSTLHTTEEGIPGMGQTCALLSLPPCGQPGGGGCRDRACAEGLPSFGAFALPLEQVAAQRAEAERAGGAGWR